MIGSHLVVSTTPIDYSSKIDILLKEPWHSLEDVYGSADNTNYDRILCSKYKGYPIKVYKKGDYIIIVEGIVYNIPDNTLESILYDIAVSKNLQRISRFVQGADGDYLISFYNKIERSAVVFNDLLGAIPYYYFADERQFIGGRSLSFVSLISRHTDISQSNLAEFLTFDYSIETDTIFCGVKQMRPGEIITYHMASCSRPLSVEFSVSPYFGIINPYQSKDAALESLSMLFLEGCASRISYARKNGYEIVNTMSGGFDSRTVLAGIEKQTSNYINLTYEYLQDESTVAQNVLRAVGSKSKYIKTSFVNKPNLLDGHLAFITDGKVNCYTNSVCYNDIKYIKSNNIISDHVLYFGGFGGEFIRHPFFPNLLSFRSVAYNYKPTLKSCMKLVGISPRQSLLLFNDKIREYARDGKSGFMKYFYNEYYRSYVRGSGEDRTRMFYYTTQPLMSKDFILAIRNKLPLSWVGFNFYRQFLNKIDPRLLQVGVFSSEVTDLSEQSLKKVDARRKNVLRNTMINTARHYLNTVHMPKHQIMDCREFEDRFPIVKNSVFFDYDFFKANYHTFEDSFLYKLVSFCLYMEEINRRVL